MEYASKEIKAGAASVGAYTDWAQESEYKQGIQVDNKAMVRTTHLRRLAVNVQAFEHVAHLFFEVAEVVSVLVVLIAVEPAPHLELVLEVTIPRTLQIASSKRPCGVQLPQSHSLEQPLTATESIVPHLVVGVFPFGVIFR